MAARVTLKDIAREANVSVGLTSKALSGYADVSEETQQRIQRIGKRLGYQRPGRRFTHARTITRYPQLHRANMLFLGGRNSDSAYGRHWIREFSLAFRERDIRLEISVIESEGEGPTEPEDILRCAEGVDGLLLFGFIPSSICHLIESIDIPCVAIGDFARGHRPVAHQVNIDKCEMARTATQMLIDRGHKRIGFFTTASPPGSWNDQWLMGYRLAMMHAGITDDASIRPIFDLFDRKALGIRAAAHMAALDRVPTAYIAPEVSIAAHFNYAMADRGIKIEPRQMIVGGDPEEAEHFGLSGFPLFSEDVTSAAAHTLNLLEQLAQGKSLPPVQSMIPCQTHNLHALAEKDER